MCGVCALTQLKEIGTISVKIVGREASLKKKVASVKLVKEMLNYSEAGYSLEEVRAQAKLVKGVKGLYESGQCLQILCTAALLSINHFPDINQTRPSIRFYLQKDRKRYWSKNQTSLPFC